MRSKHKDILTSAILLQVDPPKKKARKYYGILLSALFGFYFFYIVYVLLSTKADGVFAFGMISTLLMTSAMIVFVWVRVRPTSLIFTDKGISDSIFIGVFWEEIEFYNFNDIRDIGMKKAKRVLRLTSKKPPLYHLKFMNLPRYFFDKGLFFSEVDTAKAEEIFRNKGIPREP